MKITKLERTLFVLMAMTLAFFAGWYLGSGSGGAPCTVTTQRSENVQTAADATADPAPGIVDGEVININTASAADLERLPGIGEKRAQDIITYRETHGRFQIVEEITNVEGIGEGTLQSLLDYITVGEE